MSSLFLTAFLASFLQYLPPLISAHFFVFLENNFFRDNLSCVPLFCHEKEKKTTTYRCVTIDPTNVFSISPLPRLDYTAERRVRVIHSWKRYAVCIRRSSRSPERQQFTLACVSFLFSISLSLDVEPRARLKFRSRTGNG